MTSRIKIVLSMVVILVAIAASLGATFAWFTDVAETPLNTFEAGTVLINADDDFAAGGENLTLENWNPGDCTNKNVSVEVVGTKGTLVRASLVETWTLINYKTYVVNGVVYIEKDSDGKPIVDGDPLVYSSDNANWSQVENMAFIEFASNFDDNWIEHSDGYWYLNKVMFKDTDTSKMQFFAKVCFSEEADNRFQEATYTVSVTFEAVQASNNASLDVWGVNSLYESDPATDPVEDTPKTSENWVGWGEPLVPHGDPIDD